MSCLVRSVAIPVAGIGLSDFWVVTNAVAHATVISHATLASDREKFQAWQRFAESKAMSVLAPALATALIAGNEARSDQPTRPAWACLAAVAAALGDFAGWTMRMVLGVTGYGRNGRRRGCLAC